MKKEKNDKGSQQTAAKSIRPTGEKEVENQQKKSRNSLPVIPEKTIPVKNDLDNRRSIQNRPHQH